MDASLSSNDLVNILKIIEMCTQRGGFRAIELKGVGEIYEKISLIVQQISNKTNEQTIKSEDQSDQQEVE